MAFRNGAAPATDSLREAARSLPGEAPMTAKIKSWRDVLPTHQG
jgi:hypothetical protein